MTLAGCRAVDPTETAIGSRSVGTAAEGAVVSSNADLDFVRDTLLARGGIQTVNPDGSPRVVQYQYDGTAEIFQPTGPLGQHLISPPVAAFQELAGQNELTDELDALPPELSAVLGGLVGGGSGGDPLATCFDLGARARACDPDPDDDDDGGDDDDDGDGNPNQDNFLVANETITSQGYTTRHFDLSWDRESLRAGEPVLRFDTEFVLDIERSTIAKVLFRKLGGRVRATHFIRPEVCGTELRNTGCRTDGDTFFRGYRRLLDITGGQDARAPKLGLDFSTCSETTDVEANAQIGLRCAINVRAIGMMLPMRLREVLEAPGGAAAVCVLLARRIARDEIESSLCDVADAMSPLVSLAVNPPTLELDFEQALIAQGADTNGNGRVTESELEPVLPTLLPSLSEEELALAVSGLDRRSQQLIDVALVARGDIEAADGAPSQTDVLVSPGDGSLTDRSVLLLDRGGELRITGVVARFGRLQAACDQGGVVPLLCEACEMDVDELCTEDGRFVESIRADFDTPILSATIQPSPAIASVLEAAPFYGDLIRRWFARPLPSPDARYVGVSTETLASPRTVGSARLDYITDADQDLVDDAIDNCPTIPNREQEESDGDDFGDACDLCPGVFNERVPGVTANIFLDADGDGLPNGCDCDSDGDGCVEPGQELRDGVVVECVPPPGETFDGVDARLLPVGLQPGDFDGDGHPDACDPDIDADGVPNGLDNCPLGDGDALFDEDGESAFEDGVDDNPDQTDSGGSTLGDVCDVACMNPGDPLCDSLGAGGDPGAGGGPPSSAGIYFRGVPGAFECIGNLCQVGALIDCFGQELDLCGSFAAGLELRSGLGAIEGRLDPVSLSVDGPLSTTIAQTGGDWDGDGRSELVVSAPQATACGACPPNTDCVPTCTQAAGAILVLGSANGEVLARADGLSNGEQLGTSIHVIGEVVVAGAPGALNPQGEVTGAVKVFRLSAGAPNGLQPLSRFVGSPGDQFGAQLLVLDASWPPVLAVSAPGAESGRGAVVELSALDGVQSVWPSMVPDGGANDLAMVGRFLVVGSPDAHGGNGAVQLLDRHTGQGRVVTGNPGEALGAALAEGTDAVGRRLVAVGAPGFDAGQGAVHLIDVRTGRRTRTLQYWGESVGARLSTPGDVDGDGVAELWVAMSVDGVPYTVPWELGP